jgi:uncharacterized protein YecE (DUF72 family)
MARVSATPAAYSAQRLSAWADRMVTWSTAGMAVWAYFNNDIGGQAVIDADRLRRMVDRRQSSA